MLFQYILQVSLKSTQIHRLIFFTLLQAKIGGLFLRVGADFDEI